MTFDRRRSELRLAACAALICLMTTMKTKLQNLTHTTLVAFNCRQICPQSNANGLNLPSFLELHPN